MLASAFGAVLGSYLTGNPVDWRADGHTGRCFNLGDTLGDLHYLGRQPVSQFHGAGARCNRIFRCGTERRSLAAGAALRRFRAWSIADSFVDRWWEDFYPICPLRVYRVSGADSDSLYV